MTQITTAEAVFLITLAITYGAAILARRHSRNDKDNGLAEMKLNRWLVGLSAGTTANSGFIVTGAVGLGYGFGMQWVLLPLSWLLGDLLFWYLFPARINEVGREMRATTLSELLTANLRGAVASAVAVLCALVIVVCLTGYTSAQWLAGQKFLAGAFAVPEWVALALFALLIIGYTSIGGFRGSVYTDTLQSVIRVAGTILALVAVIWFAMADDAFSANIARAGDGFLSLWPGGVGVTIGFVLGFAGASIGFGLGQPQILSRYLAGSSPEETRSAWWIYIGFVQFTWIAMTVFGVILRGVMPGISDAETGLSVFFQKNIGALATGIIAADVFATIAATSNGLLVAMSQALNYDILPRVSRRRTRAPLWMTTLGIGAVTMLVSAVLHGTVFSVALASVSLMGAGLAPAVMIKVLGWRHSEASLLTAIIAGITAAVIWRQSGLGSIFNEAGIGIGVGLAANWIVATVHQLGSTYSVSTLPMAELRDFAKQNSLFIVREYEESQSAKAPGRLVFNEMLGEMEKGVAQGILAWNPDRLARNSVDGGRVIYLIDVEIITTLKFPTFWFEPTPQGKFMLSVAFGQAKYYTDNLRENILRGIRQKIRRGELSAKAPLGYFNEPKLRTIEPDKKTFAKVKECLGAFATGQFTLTAIQGKMFSVGLVSKDGKPLALSSVQKILTNPFYYGHFQYRGEVHEGSHKPMISKKLFDQIQAALVENGKPRKKRGEKGFLWKGFAVCGECGYAITAERKTKKSGRVYHYYHCTFKSRTQKCSQTRFLREEELTRQVKAEAQKVSLPDEWRDKFLARLNGEQTEVRQSSGLFAQNLRDEISSVKLRLKRLTDAYLAEALELSEYLERKNALTAQKRTLEEKLSDFERKGTHWLELMRNWILDANQAENLIRAENLSGMKDFLMDIGSNRRIAAGMLAGEFRKPWHFLAEMPLHARGSAARGLCSSSNQLWWTYGESDPDLVHAMDAFYR